MQVDFDVRDNRRCTFSLEEALLWIMDLYFRKKQWFEVKHMLTDGLEWCGLLVDYCDVFISCLDSHSDGTHSLQRSHWWASDGMLHFSKSDEETNSSTFWMDWGWVHFQQFFIFWVNYSFNTQPLSSDLGS